MNDIAVHEFQFPELGPTGEGEIQNEGKHGELFWSSPDMAFYVTLQEDHPAVAYRCHYPRGSAPCDEVTARRFIRWCKNVKNQTLPPSS